MNADETAPAQPATSAPPLPPRLLLKVRGLEKRYGQVQVLRGLDLEVREGEVYGFLGRNGAGKSTAIRLIMGITAPSRGQIELFGERLGWNAVRLRQRIGYVGQEQSFYSWMTVDDIGRFVRGFYPSWDGAEFQRLRRGLALPEAQKIGTFSGGTKVKLALALALAHRPQLLVLDEPTSGLDAVARREFIELFRDEAERCGRTTFFSSHIIDEVELAADRVGIIEDGRMLYEGRLEPLSEEVRLWRGADAALLDGELEGRFEILQDRVRRGQRERVLRARAASDYERLAARWPEAAIERLKLEDIFIELVRKPLQ